MKSKPISLIQGNTIATIKGVDIEFFTRESSTTAVLNIYGICSTGEISIAEPIIGATLAGRNHITVNINKNSKYTDYPFIGIRWELSDQANGLLKITRFKLINEVENLDTALWRVQ